MVKNLPARQEIRVWWLPTPVLFPGESHGQGSLESYIVHRVAKQRTHTLLKQLTHTHTHTHRVYFNQFIVILGYITWNLFYWFIFKFFLIFSIPDPPWNDGRNWLWSWWNSLSGGMDSRRHDNNSTPCAPGLRKCKYLHRCGNMVVSQWRSLLYILIINSSIFYS